MPLNTNLHGKIMGEMLQQLLIVLVKRAGGEVTVPIADIDNTGQDLLAMQLTEDKGVKAFRFVVRKKS